MTSATSSVLDLPGPPPKADWQCRTAECDQPVLGGLVLCTGCSILFGPYDALLSNTMTVEWDFDEPDLDAG